MRGCATWSGCTWTHRPTDRGLRGREVPDRGAGAYPTGPTDGAGPARAAHPRLRPARHDHLVAALEVATGRVTDACHPRHRHIEFLGFLKQVAKAYSRRRLHVVLDNYATHKHAKVQAWLAAHPRVRLHFTPTHASWLNLVEVFFAIIDRQALRRGDFAGVDDLVAAIRRFCDGWNQRCQPFTWTKDADQILTKLNRQNTSAADSWPPRGPSAKLGG